MAIKTYEYDYNFGEAYAKFKVDTDKFTNDKAQVLLDFFSWTYDKNEPPVDEIMKKYAMKAIVVATAEECNEYGVKRWFETAEGVIRLDGSEGVELIRVSAYKFYEEDLSVEITEK